MDDSPPWDRSKLIENLKAISKYEGKFRWSDKGKQLYKEWYIGFNRKLEERDDDKTGTSARIHDHILKVAMILSMSKGPELIITEHDVEEALELSGYFEGSARRVIVGKGKSEMATKLRLLLDDLLIAEGNEVSRKKLLSRRYGDFDAYDLDRMIDNLSQGDSIEIIKSNDGPIYKLREKYVKQFQMLIRASAKPVPPKIIKGS